MKQKTVLIECSTASAETGGNVGLSQGVIEYFTKQTGFNVFVLCNKFIYDKLTPLAKEKVIGLSVRPAESIYSFIRWRKLFLVTVDSIKPDLIFVPYGPIYIKTNIPMFVGFAEPWRAKIIALRYISYSPIEKIFDLIRKYVKRYYYKQANFFWTETEVGRNDIIDFIAPDRGNIFTIPNNVPIGLSKSKFVIHDFDRVETFVFFFPAAPYKHKNHLFLIEAWDLMPSREKIELWLTIPSSAKKLIKKISNSLGVDSIQNFGFVTQDGLVDLYSKTSVVIIPSMAEVFSATYLEAFYIGRPLIVPNLPFARQLAGSAALYFEPGDSKSLIDCMVSISTNKVLFEHLALESRKRISLFPTFEEKMKMIGHTVTNILNNLN